MVMPSKEDSFKLLGAFADFGRTDSVDLRDLRTPHLRSDHRELGREDASSTLILGMFVESVNVWSSAEVDMAELPCVDCDRSSFCNPLPFSV